MKAHLAHRALLQDIHKLDIAATNLKCLLMALDQSASDQLTAKQKCASSAVAEDARCVGTCPCNTERHC